MMNRKYLLISICLPLLGIAGWAEEAGSAQNTNGYQYDDYQIVSERNIFSRSRASKRDMRDEGTRRQKKVVVLSFHVLKGVAVNKSRKIAFIEEEVSGEFTKARVGDQVVNGKIKGIRNDYVLFEEGGRIRKIKIGEPFGKQESLDFESSDSDESTQSEETPQSDASVPSEQEDILKRMIERRKNELGN